MTIYDFKRLVLQKTESRPFFLQLNLYNQAQLSHLLQQAEIKDIEYNAETPSINVFLDMQNFNLWIRDQEDA